MRKIRIILALAVVLVVFSITAHAAVDSKKMPDLQFRDLSGKVVKVSDFRGQYVVFDFWATWCGPCVQAMKEYKKNLIRMETAGIKLVAVSVDTDVAVVKDFVVKEDIPFTILHDKTNISGKELGIRGIPTVYMIDPEGNIIMTKVGWSDFESFWSKVSHALSVSKNPPVRVQKLKEGSYKTKVVPINEIYTNLEIPYKNRLYPFIDSPAVLLKKEPKYQNTPKYATIAIGEKVITIAAEKTEKSKVANKLYVDFDNDGDLTDPKELITLDVGTDGKGNYVSSWGGDLKIQMAKGVTVTYRIVCYFSSTSNGEYYLMPVEGYQAMVETENGEIEVAVVDINSNGKYGDNNDIIVLDLNQNSKFDSDLGAEWIFPTSILQLENGKYQIKVMQNGKEIVVKEAK